jgi:hypothetical protein
MRVFRWEQIFGLASLAGSIPSTLGFHCGVVELDIGATS